MSTPSPELIAAIDARIIEIKFRIDAIFATMQLLANPEELSNQLAIESHVLDLMRVRRHKLAEELKSS